MGISMKVANTDKDVTSFGVSKLTPRRKRTSRNLDEMMKRKRNFVNPQSAAVFVFIAAIIFIYFFTT